jgi:hypothetical protein
MSFKKTMALGMAAATAATLGATAVVGGSAAGAGERAGIPTAVVRMNGNRIHVVGGNTLHAGRIAFKVTTGDRAHVLQILRLHHGYTVQDAGQDFGPAFGGDLDAIRRLDENITWRGGAETKPGKPGWFVVTLRQGEFKMFDQNGGGLVSLHVVGDVPPRPNVAHSSTITAFSYGFESSPETIPAAGTLYFKNQADQPHFLEIQHVKDGTTRRQVMHGLHSQGQPDFVLKGSTGTGVISPQTGQMFRYDLPAGRYVIMCFWPASDTGMPHAFMGMFKLITLK